MEPQLMANCGWAFQGWSSYMGVSKNRGTPKWMVYMENPIKMDDLGVPPFKETISEGKL